MKVKGLRVDNKQVVKGYLVVDEISGQHFIHTEGTSVNESNQVGEEGFLRFVAFEVIPETVVKSIGKSDSKGNEIFEYDTFYIYGEYDNGLYTEDRSGTVYVAYNAEHMQYCYYSLYGKELDSMYEYFEGIEDSMEGFVTGNIKHQDT